MNYLLRLPKVNDKFVGSGIVVPTAHPPAIDTEGKAALDAKKPQGYNFRRVMIGIQTFILLAFVSLLTACSATIPQESVDLSREVGIGLRKQYQAQVDLVNLHFSIRQERLDKAMSRAIDTHFGSLMAKDSIELNRAQMKAVAEDVLLYHKDNNSAKAELEKARLLLIKKLNGNYLKLNQANASITNLLQSAVDIQEATTESYKKLSDDIGGIIDLDEIFSALDDFVLKDGKEADNLIELTKKLEDILKIKENEQ